MCRGIENKERKRSGKEYGTQCTCLLFHSRMRVVKVKELKRSPKGEWEEKLEIMADQPTKTDRPTVRLIGKFHSHKSALIGAWKFNF